MSLELITGGVMVVALLVYLLYVLFNPGKF